MRNAKLKFASHEQSSKIENRTRWPLFEFSNERCKATVPVSADEKMSTKRTSPRSLNSKRKDKFYFFFSLHHPQKNFKTINFEMINRMLRVVAEGPLISLLLSVYMWWAQAFVVYSNCLNQKVAHRIKKHLSFFDNCPVPIYHFMF